MKYFLPFALTTVLVVAFGSENDLWDSNGILLARQRPEPLDLSRRSRSQSHARFEPAATNSPLKRRYLLPRSGNAPGLSRSDAGRGSPDRSRGQSMKAKVYAQGPAVIELGSSNGRQRETIAEDQHGVLRDEHHNWAVINAQSHAQPGSDRSMKAKLKGSSVVGSVIPPPGGRGKIEIKKDGNTRRIDITNPHGESETEVSSQPGGVTMETSVSAGGKMGTASLPINVDEARARGTPP